ncbi:ABC transporter permease [Sinorhizobium alkalisoli]|uniref:ABC transporter permease n=1 Tax=Sinorhizobium alkalisoli TaxID=1752398 RepID=UPI00124BE38E|nr:ribose ABC transporter permease [Sinorhizobium alkalisoli]QFI68756.1 Ribose ABC transport system, permease protein RbsC [Sinorhizobium alkalisoli]
MDKGIDVHRAGVSDRLSAPTGILRLLGRFSDQLVPGAFLLVLVVGLSLLSPNFLSVGNFLDIARVGSIIGIMAVGMTLVILTGGIDLSVGSTFALAAVVTASFVPNSFSDAPTSIGVDLPVPLAIAAGLSVGAGIGFVNGFIIAKSRVEPFIVTLATMAFVRGLTYLYTGGFPTIFRPMPPAFEWVGQGYVFGIPTPTIFFALVVAVGLWITRRTTFGRSIYAIGGNEQASRLSGINVQAVKIRAYTLLGALAALSGIILSSRVAAAQPTAGLTYELDVIAGVIIGGTSLLGGRGSVMSTVLGVFILGVISNGLNVIGVETYYQYVVKGLLLIIAVGLDAQLRKRA